MRNRLATFLAALAICDITGVIQITPQECSAAEGPVIVSQWGTETEEENKLQTALPELQAGKESEGPGRYRAETITRFVQSFQQITHDESDKKIENETDYAYAVGWLKNSELNEDKILAIWLRWKEWNYKLNHGFMDQWHRLLKIEKTGEEGSRNYYHGDKDPKYYVGHIYSRGQLLKNQP